MVFPESRTSTAPTHNPPPTSPCGTIETPSMGLMVHYLSVFVPSVARFLIYPPTFLSLPNLSLTSPSLSYCVPPSYNWRTSQKILLGYTFQLIRVFRSDQGGLVTILVGWQGVHFPTNHAFFRSSVFPISVMTSTKMSTMALTSSLLRSCSSLLALLFTVCSDKIVSIWLSLLSSALPFPLLKLLIYLKITYH